MLLDEIFGESNRVGLVTVIHNPKGRNLSKYFSENSEFMLVYAKDISSAIFNDVVIDEDKQATFDLIDDQGKYRLEPFMRVRTSWSRKNKPRCHYPIYVSKDLKDMTIDKKPGYYEVFPKTEDGREQIFSSHPSSSSAIFFPNQKLAFQTGVDPRHVDLINTEKTYVRISIDYQYKLTGTNHKTVQTGRIVKDYSGVTNFAFELVADKCHWS